jgi:hypothetical protein
MPLVRRKAPHCGILNVRGPFRQFQESSCYRLRCRDVRLGHVRQWRLRPEHELKPGGAVLRLRSALAAHHLRQVRTSRFHGLYETIEGRWLGDVFLRPKRDGLIAVAGQ